MTTARRARAASPILRSVQESVRDLHEAGAVDQATMREFDVLCLAPLEPESPREVLPPRDCE
jgi:putative transcriptional regulator